MSTVSKAVSNTFSNTKNKTAKNVLRIDSSLAGDKSTSSQLMDELIENLRLRESQNVNVIQRQLSSETVPHVDSEWLAALLADEEKLSVEQKLKRAYADEQIQQIKAADIIVIGAPMYNFTVPSVLKAWFDHIARAGETFRFTSQGPEGLLKNKKVYLVTTRGGFHAGKSSDALMPFLDNILSFVGLTDVDVIFAEGLDMGGDHREKGLALAKEKISSLLAA